MALRFIIGHTGFGKTTQCMTEILNTQKNFNTKQILIVPEQFTSQTERDFLQLSKNHAMIQCEVLSFARLAQRMFSKFGLNEKVLMDDIAKSMTLQKIVLQEKNQLKYYQNMIQKTGFIEQLNLTFSEFAQYNITPKILLELAQKNRLPMSIQDKLQDLNVIYEAYTAFLQKDYISTDEQLTILSNFLEKESLFHDTSFWIDGFYGFTPQEINVITHLAQKCQNITITLPLNEQTFKHTALPKESPFFEPYRTKTALIQRMQEISVSIESPIFLHTNHKAQNESLKNLEAHYFQGFYQTCSLHEHLSIQSCINREAECEWVAGSILKLIRLEHLRFKNIAILTNDLPAFEKIIKGKLKEFDIPFFVDTKQSITSHPLIILIQSFLDILLYHFSYDHIFSYLKSGLSILSTEEIDILENYVLAYGIEGYKWYDKKPWKYGMKKEGEEQISYINELREKVLVHFRPLLHYKTKSSILFSDLIQDIIQHMKYLHINEKLSLWHTTALQKNDLIQAEEHKQIWKKVFEVLKTAHNILGDTPLSLSECVRILSAGFEKCRMGLIPQSSDCIIVGDLERSRLPDISHLFVIGANDGILPSPSAPTAIFTESERQLLQELDVELASSNRQKIFQEQFLIYTGLTRPSQKLFLSLSEQDLESKELFPSPVIDRLLHMDKQLSISYTQEFQLEQHTKKTAFHQLGTELYKEELSPLWKDIYSFYKMDSSFQNALNILYTSFDTKFTPKLSKPLLKQLYGNQIFSSVSKLERYASCPFSYFMEYNLKAKSRPLYELKIPDIGNLFHAVLDEFHTKIETEYIDIKQLKKEDVQTHIHNIINDIAPNLNNEILLSSASNQYLIERLKRIATTATWTLISHMQTDDFVPIAHELAFGINEALPPISIILNDNTQLILSGKIDRLDVLKANNTSFVKIIDYKTGSKKFLFEDIYYGLQLQLLLYMDSYLHHAKKDSSSSKLSLKPAGMFYFQIKDPKIEISKSMNAETIQEELYKKLCMTGLALHDKHVIEGLDHIFKENLNSKKSAIVPISFKKDGTATKDASLATEEEYTDILKFAQTKTISLGNQILSGDISATPFDKNGKQPCSYCIYHSICQYDYSTINIFFRCFK